MSDINALNDIIDPAYVQVTRKQAAQILGRSPTEFDRMRRNDPRCPTGFKSGYDRSSRVLFRLSDIYDYSQQLMGDSEASA